MIFRISVFGFSVQDFENDDPKAGTPASNSEQIYLGQRYGATDGAWKSENLEWWCERWSENLEQRCWPKIRNLEGRLETFLDYDEALTMKSKTTNSNTRGQRPSWLPCLPTWLPCLPPFRPWLSPPRPWRRYLHTNFSSSLCLPHPNLLWPHRCLLWPHRCLPLPPSTIFETFLFTILQKSNSS